MPPPPTYTGCHMRPKLASRTAALVALLTLGAPVHDAVARSFLWKATGPQGVVYLVGSVHMLSKDYYPLSPALETAFKDSDLLVEEADLGEMLSPDSQFKMLSQGMLPENQSLQRVLSPTTYALVSKRVADLGMPIEVLQRFKPWFLALTIMSLSWQSSGLDPELGLDKHFYDLALAEGKPVQGFETAAYQISRFDEMTMEQQDHLLSDSITDLDAEQSNVTKLADAWRIGDEPTVERIVLQGLNDDPQMYQRLLVDRNRNWLPTIEAFFNRKGRTFVVVGAAHLVGPDGLLAILKSKGYSIEQL
jgi:uncharacterized protein YbaP (TraB family)